jgi:hypothetical protein
VEPATVGAGKVGTAGPEVPDPGTLELLPPEAPGNEDEDEDELGAAVETGTPDVVDGSGASDPVWAEARDVPSIDAEITVANKIANEAMRRNPLEVSGFLSICSGRTTYSPFNSVALVHLFCLKYWASCGNLQASDPVDLRHHRPLHDELTSLGKRLTQEGAPAKCSTGLTPFCTNPIVRDPSQEINRSLQ